MTSIGDLVQIMHFDDGNQEFKNVPNVWKIIEFQFNKSKCVIQNMTLPNMKPRSISSWKINRIEVI